MHCFLILLFLLEFYSDVRFSNFSFPTVDEFVKRFQTDSAFATQIDAAFEATMTAASLRAALEAAYDDVDEDVLRQLTVALNEPMSIGGIALPELGPHALMVAVFCKGGDLVVRYKIGPGGFLDMVRTPKSTTCDTAG